jgi:hypothetical protein
MIELHCRRWRKHVAALDRWRLSLEKIPITWEYNRTHKNVESDFVRELD